MEMLSILIELIRRDLSSISSRLDSRFSGFIVEFSRLPFVSTSIVTMGAFFLNLNSMG